MPAGWVECDGNNGSPDLRSRFVVGATSKNGLDASPLTLSSYNIDDKGGEELHTLNINEMPSHTHNTKLWKHHRSFRGENDDMHPLIQIDDNGGQPSFTSDLTGGNMPHENRPPFYALMYIMKL